MDSSNGRYTCPLCPVLRFASVGDKRRHMRDSHGSEVKVKSHG